MMFKNSIKLLCANFDKVWKLLLFHILCFALCFGLLSVFYNLFANAIVSAWETTILPEVFKTGTLYGFTFKEVLESIVSLFFVFFETIFKQNVFAGIYFCIITFYVLPFLINIGKFVTNEMLYGFMASAQKQSFTVTFLRTLNKSLQFSFIKTLYTIPFNALMIFSIVGLASINNAVFEFVLPLVFVIVLSILFAFKQTFSCGWSPAMIVFDVNVCKGYRLGARAILRRGARFFSTALVFCILGMVLSMVLGIYSIIIIIPIAFPLLDILEMTAFFSSQGMRFYVDYDTILSPKKLEEVDKIEKAKYIL